MEYPKIIWTHVTSDLPFERQHNCSKCHACHYVILDEAAESDYLKLKSDLPNFIAEDLRVETMDEFHSNSLATKKSCPMCMMGSFIGAISESAGDIMQLFKKDDGTYDDNLLLRLLFASEQCSEAKCGQDLWRSDIASHMDLLKSIISGTMRRRNK